MAQALEHTAAQAQTRTANVEKAKLDWRRKMSDHVAFALLTYTGLHIFVTATVLKATNNTILPYLALVVLVLAIIPGCRMFEKRWSELSDEEAANPDLARAFSRDRLAIWLFAIGLPFALTAFFKGMGILLS
ncbi:hypothetical protein [Alteraurantiacibacter aestuarii]|uniref:Uncharacterized protein n=1 Tax=Alteraurantiacibacter aestuarii TaxID=650004 RepID=A0A844ZJ50_9SPHN|nr:hypothetical protein [Alteraurantiacibacter aestuarii]MXO87176.1 hypothetical protein [Alteraurantiacibacter aestuarii]